MWKFIWTNVIGIAYFITALAELFVILLILTTPITMAKYPYEISWWTFVVCLLMVIGYPIAFLRSYKGVVTDLKDVWRKGK